MDSFVGELENYINSVGEKLENIIKNFENKLDEIENSL
jgi:hypothetical protein